MAVFDLQPDGRAGRVMQINTIPIKLVEKAPLLYFSVTGMLFMLVPSTLNAPVYEYWKILSALQWGMIVLVVCAIHMAALIWNGRSAVKSRFMRAAALAGYMYISIQWGLNFFLAGAYWGTTLFWVLMPVLCVPIYLRLVGEIKWIKGRNDA